MRKNQKVVGEQLRNLLLRSLSGCMRWAESNKSIRLRPETTIMIRVLLYSDFAGVANSCSLCEDYPYTPSSHPNDSMGEG